MNYKNKLYPGIRSWYGMYQYMNQSGQLTAEGSRLENIVMIRESQGDEYHYDASYLKAMAFDEISACMFDMYQIQNVCSALAIRMDDRIISTEQKAAYMRKIIHVAKCDIERAGTC